MTTIATIGPEGSHAFQAARQHDVSAEILPLPHAQAVCAALAEGSVDLAVLPVYNTREGQSKEFFRLMRQLPELRWRDNLVLPIHLSLGAVDLTTPLTSLVGRPSILRQCEEFIADNFPDATLIATRELTQVVERIRKEALTDHGVIEAEAALAQFQLAIRAREVIPYNRTRYAVIGHTLHPPTGYDATAVTTKPLKDRVGLLHGMLGEFAGRGINVLDIQAETDPKTQELQFFIEMEGHIEDEDVREALERIERQVIQEEGAIRLLGCFPRVDMRTKRIKRIGFIGTGDMSKWFARRLAGEGYETVLTGRSTTLRPEEMIPTVDVVAVCVPISATPETVKRYGPLLKDHQALVLFAGEAEESLATALSHTADQVEVMLIHNLWGPKAATMKDKNVSVVRTIRSGVLCSEIEAFLYKHGANISVDTAEEHNLLMGVSQKLPTAISMALGLTLKEHQISPRLLEDHSTLTSIYSILSMARVHHQNPRTYAEILASPGQGRTVLRSFVENLAKVLNIAEGADIDTLCRMIEENREHLTPEFLRLKMRQALEVDKALGKIITR